MISRAIGKTSVAAVFVLFAAPAVADDMTVCAKATGDASISACSRVIDKGGRDLSLAYYSRGRARQLAGSNDLAISDFNEAISRKPDFTEAIISRGNIYYTKRDLDRSLVEFNDAIRRKPKYAAGYQGRGAIYFEKGQYDLAIADYNEAIKLEGNSLYYGSRALVYANKGDFDRAIADYSQAIKIKSDEYLYYYHRARAYESKKDYDRALEDLNEAVRLNQKDVAVFRERGALFNARGQTDKAVADLTEAIKLNPAEAMIYRERAVIRRNAGNLDAALVDFDEAIKRNPTHPSMYAGRGLTYEKRGDTVRARQDFELALAQPTIANDAVAKAAVDAASERLAALSSSSPTTAAPATTVAAPAAAPVTSSSSNDRRVALVIGNSAYRNVPSLPNPQRDAALVANALKKSGFTSVTLQTDLTKDTLANALRTFAQTAETADWAVVYYAGHGMEVGGTNYLLPVDARIAADRDIGFEAVALDQVLNAAERAKKLRLVILDACRDNPFANQMKRTMTVASRSVSRGLAAVEPEAGTLVVYAAKDGETALDGDGANSPFATAFVKNLQTPNLEVRRLFDFVRDDVMDVTKRKQKPFSYGSISGRQDFYFVAAK